jgi:hypothetical protein
LRVADSSTATIRLSGQLEYDSPEWWLKRLLTLFTAQQLRVRDWEEYHDGNQPLAFASDKFRETFGRRYGGLPANFMPLIIDAESERLIVQGFRFNNKTEGDGGAWRVWQENQLDAESQIAHDLALIKGISFAMVSPPMKGSDFPLITIEDPSEVVVESVPGNRRLRRAALKVWMDDEGYGRANMFLPDAVYKFRTRVKRTDSSAGSLPNVTWDIYDTEDEGVWPIKNPSAPEIPIIPLINRPRRDGTGRSELQSVIGNQNAINKLRFDALVASEFVAFPQRYALNIDVPVDPDTGRDIAPFKPGVDMLWTVRRPTPEEAATYGDKVPTPMLGQFPQGDLSPYIDLINQEVGEMASNGRTPYHYLLSMPTSVPPSGESLKASEARLVKKVVRQSVHFGEGWEETMRLALILYGQNAKAKTDGETIWADPETRNEAARTDAIIKQVAIGLPFAFALEELGYSQTQISRILLLKAAEDEVRKAEAQELMEATAKAKAAASQPDDANDEDGLDNDGGSAVQ